MENNNSFVKQYYLFILFTMYRNPWLQICWFSCALGVKQIAHEAVWIPLWFSPPIRVHQENLKECLKNPHEIYQFTSLPRNLDFAGGEWGFGVVLIGFVVGDVESFIFELWLLWGEERKFGSGV